jgi:hypothetical protein
MIVYMYKLLKHGVFRREEVRTVRPRQDEPLLLVRKTRPLFTDESDHFAKTGSGQT